MPPLSPRSAHFAFGLVFAFILAGALINYSHVRRMHATDELVRHTLVAIAALQSARTMASEADKGQTELLHADEDRFVRTYRVAMTLLQRELNILESAVGRDEWEEARLTEIKQLVRSRLSWLDEKLRRRSGDQPFISLDRRHPALPSERLTNDLQDADAAMERQELRLLSLRNQEAETAHQTARFSGFMSTGFSLLLGIVAYVLVIRETHHNSRVAEQLRMVNDRLEERVRQRTEKIHDVISNLRAEIDVRQAAEEAAQQSAEGLQRSNRELELFASVASHDLQEPLRKIQAFADHLERESRDQLGVKGCDYLNRIVASAGRMRQLIDALLTYSRVTSKAQTFVVVDLNRIVTEVVSDLESRIQQTGGRIEVSTLPPVFADPAQMRQLFQNLLGNALKFHRPDIPPEIAISSRRGADFQCQEEEANCQFLPLYVTVSDNGIGFEPEYKDRVFELFQRLHSRQEYEGTGIGLAICKQIVERHGGRIWTDSAPGKGTVFTFTLPLESSLKQEQEDRLWDNQLRS